MALLSAPFTSAPPPAVMDPSSFAQHGLSEGLVTSSALPPALGRSLLASNSLPAAFPRQLASFPTVSPALSVMIPTAAGTGLQTSPRASQVYIFASQKAVKSLLVHITAQAAQLLVCCMTGTSIMLLQSEVLTLRVMQDTAFQQAVQAGQVQAAAKAAVSLLAVSPAKKGGLIHSMLAWLHRLSCTSCTCNLGPLLSNTASASSQQACTLLFA